MNVKLLTRDEAVARRDELLRKVGMSEHTLSERARRYELTLEQRAVADEVEGLTYLLEAPAAR